MIQFFDAYLSHKTLEKIGSENWNGNWIVHFEYWIARTHDPILGSNFLMIFSASRPACHQASQLPARPLQPATQAASRQPPTQPRRPGPLASWLARRLMASQPTAPLWLAALPAEKDRKNSEGPRHGRGANPWSRTFSFILALT